VKLLVLTGFYRKSKRQKKSHFFKIFLLSETLSDKKKRMINYLKKMEYYCGNMSFYQILPDLASSYQILPLRLFCDGVLIISMIKKFNLRQDMVISCNLR